jgi:hypothetical protein
MEEEWLRNLRAEDDAVPEDPTPVPDDPLEEIGEILASMSKGKEKAHKRTISEVIPREEREVEREKETAQVNAQVNGDSEVNEIAQIDKDNAPSGLRRSGRPLSPANAAEVLNTMHDQVNSDLVYKRTQVFLYLSNNSNILTVQLVG